MIFFSYSSLGAGLLMSFHRHSVVHQLHSAAIIGVRGADEAMAFHIFFYLSNWDGAPLGIGALHRLRTLGKESGGTGSECSFESEGTVLMLIHMIVKVLRTV